MQKIYLVVVVALCAVVGVLRAQCEAEVVESFVGEASDAALVGDLLYVANGRGGLRIFDVSDPSRPVKIGGVRPPALQSVSSVFSPPVDGAQVVKIEGDLAYIGDHSSGLMIFDVSEPTNPILLSTLPEVRGLGDFRVRDGMAYVVQRVLGGGVSEGFVVVDVSDPQQPAIVGTLPIPRDSPMSVELQGEIAFVGANNFLRVVDISDPTQPAEILPPRFIPELSSIHAMQRVDDRLYVAGRNRLSIFDCTDPLNLQLLGSRGIEEGLFSQIGAARGIQIDHGYAFITQTSAGLLVYDISDPQDIVKVSEGYFGFPYNLGPANVYGARLGVVVEGGVAYICGGSHGVAIVDIGDRQAPQRLSNQFTPRFMQSIAVQDGIAFATADFVGLVTMDVSDPTNISSLGLARWPSQPFNAVLDGDVAFFSGGSRLFAVSVVDPTQPVEIASLQAGPGGGIFDVLVEGGIAYIAIDNRLVTADVSNPAQMQILSDTILGARYLAVDGGLLYAAGPGGLRIVDIADPAQPVLIQTFGTGYTDIAVEGDYAFAVSMDGLQIVYVADPQNPLVVSELAAPHGWASIQVENGIAYITKQSNNFVISLQIIDVSLPARPVVLDVIGPIDGATGSLAYDNGYVYIASLYGGLQVVDVSGCVAAPPCLGDIADEFGLTSTEGGGANGIVDFGDFAALLGLIGPCDGGTPGCLGDIADDLGLTAADGGGPDGVVDLGDFVALLGLVGTCS